MLARAAARAGLPFVLSTASNARLEAIHSTAPTGINWLQVYVMSDRSISEQMVRRALERDFGALVLTVDVPTNGNRRRDIRNGFRFPFRPGIRTLLNMARHPGWLVRMARHGAPGFVNLTEVEDSTTAATLGAALLAREMDRGLVWESLSWLRRIWSGPLVLKGILHPDDARKAVHHGVDAILVSNHGGRQLDAAPSTVAALAPIVDAVGARVPVFVDSGFRNGGDIAKALALGARAVFIGRPAVYGLAYGAEEGVSEVLRLLMTELVRTMTLLGVPAVHQIDRTYLASQRTL